MYSSFKQALQMLDVINFKKEYNDDDSRNEILQIVCIFCLSGMLVHCQLL